MPQQPASEQSCVVIAPGETFQGKQGLSYFAGISAQTAGAHGICMHLLNLPPGARSQAHLHEHHETAIYVIAGEGSMWYGEGLRQHLTVHAGQFLYVPPNVPHLVYNSGETVATAVVARTDPNEQESVLPYDAPDPGVKK